MNFSVSKIRFLINESFTLILIAIICTILDILLNGCFSISVISWLYGFLYFCLKIDWYWRDELYINDNYIKLHRIKIFGASDLHQDNTLTELDCFIENLDNFIETPAKFILFGDTQKNSKHYTGTIKSKSIDYMDKKDKKRLVIRKNFKDIKKIRELLTEAVNSK